MSLFSLENLYQQYLNCRRGKRNTANALRFEARQEQELLALLALLAQLPRHKTVFHAPPGVGLPIGNLNSQFFANVVLNALDQFAKHTLKCRWYLRYCDDFVLLAQSPDELLAWRERISVFLAEELALKLNSKRQRLCPVNDELDFLGYIVRPSHLLVRRRVVGHLRDCLRAAERLLIERPGRVEVAHFRQDSLDALQASLASYLGHLCRAASYNLRAQLWRKHPWLLHFFEIDAETGTLRRRDSLPTGPPRRVLAQYAHWQREFVGDVVWMQLGAFVEELRWLPRGWPSQRPATRRDGLRPMRPNARGAKYGFPLRQLQRRVVAAVGRGQAITFVAQTDPVASPGWMARRPTGRWVSTTSNAPHVCQTMPVAA